MEDKPRLDPIWLDWVQSGYSVHLQIPRMGPIGGYAQQLESPIGSSQGFQHTWKNLDPLDLFVLVYIFLYVITHFN